MQATTEPLFRLNGHSGGVLKIDWLISDPSVLFSSDKDGKILVWNLQNGQILSEFNSSSGDLFSLKSSRFFPGLVLVSGNKLTQLISFSLISSSFIPSYLLPNSGIKVGFDGKVHHYHRAEILSFQYQNEHADISEFVKFIECLESNSVSEFVSSKISQFVDENDKKVWELISISLHPETFREKILSILNVNPEDQVEVLEEDPFEETNESESLFGSTGINENDFKANEVDYSSILSSSDILPNQEEDFASYQIAQFLISGDIEKAVACAIEKGKWSEALSIASCGSDELFKKTRAQFLTYHQNPLYSLIKNIVDGKLEYIVGYTDIQNWKQIYAIISNFGQQDFSKLCNQLGRRLISETDNYLDALICFISGKDYSMIRQCLFQINQKNNQDSSTILSVLQQVCILTNSQTDAISPIAISFLQYVIQSGHKEEAIRFTKIFPNNKQLEELRNALSDNEDISQQIQQLEPTNTFQLNINSSLVHPPSSIPTSSQFYSSTSFVDERSVGPSHKQKVAPPSPSFLHNIASPVPKITSPISAPQTLTKTLPPFFDPTLSPYPTQSNNLTRPCTLR